MHRFPMRWLGLLLSLVLLAVAGPLPVVTAAGAGGPAHWALPHALRLKQELGWKVAPDLNKPIEPALWNVLVSRLAGVEPGDAPLSEDRSRHIVWMYTGGMARGKESMAREDAIGGLMKLLSLLHGEKGFTADPAALKAFGDGPAVADHQRVLVAGAVKLGLVSGYPDGALRLSQPLTHGEGVTLVARLLSRYGRANGLPPQEEPAPQPRAKQPRGFGVGLPPLGFTPDGTKEMWIMVEGKLGQSKEKPGWNSAIRSPAGDLPGPERVYPHRTGPREGHVRLEGTYATLAEAAAVTAGARVRSIPAWIELEPDGRYAAIMGVQYWEKQP